MSNDFDVPMGEADQFVRVSTDYYKGRGELVVHLSPVEKRDGMISFLLTSGKSLVWEKMSRKNARRIAAVQAEAVAQVAARSGRVRDALVGIARAEMLTIPEAKQAL